VQALANEASYGLSGGLLWVGLLHSLWLGLASAAFVALLFQVRRPLSHASRHATLLAALSLVTLGPPAFTAIQYHLAPARPSGDAPTGATTAVVVLPGSRRILSQVTPAPSSAPRPGRLSPTEGSLRFLGLMLTRATVAARAIQPFALAAWSLAVVGLSAMLALGVVGVDRLLRGSSPAPEDVRERARKLGRRLRLKNVPAVQVHATLGEPCLIGLFRPVILLPERWLTTARGESLDAVLAHELAHARRLDHLVNLTQRFIEILLFFHPGVHWLSRSLRRHREFCADALAVRATGDALAMALALESVARFRIGPPSSLPVGAALGGEKVPLLPRIQELIGMTPIRPRPQFWPFAALPLAVAFALVAVSAGLAQDTPRPRNAPRPASKSPQVARPGQPAPAPVPAPTPPSGERLISYEVRLVNIQDEPWHHYLKGRLKPLEPEAEGRGWVIAHGGLVDFMNHIMANPTTNLLQAPKLTAYENARATVVRSPDKFSATSHSKSESKPAQPVDRDNEGTRIDLNGSRTPRGTRLSVDLRDSRIAAGRDVREDEPKADASHRPPATGEVRFKKSCDIPKGSSLLVSMGSHERRLGTRSETSELLVIITPRCFTLEPESPVPAKAAEKTTSGPVAR